MQLSEREKRLVLLTSYLVARSALIAEATASTLEFAIDDDSVFGLNGDLANELIESYGKYLEMYRDKIVEAARQSKEIQQRWLKEIADA